MTIIIISPDSYYHHHHNNYYCYYYFKLSLCYFNLSRATEINVKVKIETVAACILVINLNNFAPLIVSMCRQPNMV